MKSMPIETAAANLREIFAVADKITVTIDGSPAGVILSFDEYQALQGMLLLSGDPERLARNLELHRQFQNGDLTNFKDTLEIK